MFIQTRTIIVEKGNSDKVVERFSQTGILDDREGLIDITVMENKQSKEHEEIVVFIRWESEEAWKSWEKSPEHIAGHKNSRGQEPPAFVISTTVNKYIVKAQRKGQFSKNQE